MKKLKILSRSIILFSLIFLSVSLSILFTQNSAPKKKFLATKKNQSNKIIFLSDTQSPIWVETLIVQKNNNESARDKIFSEINSQNPKAVFHLGDLVSLGFYQKDWKDIDEFTNSLYEKGTEFYPAIGNHELFLFPKVGELNFKKRYPFSSNTGYTIREGSLAVILLNSNFVDMSESEITKQQIWYKNQLVKFEQDSTISSIIVGCHHPPFTNNTIVYPDKNVLEKFVQPFVTNKKCKVFLSGHSHAFEHFKYEGKDFLVLGGSGGLQQPLLMGDASKWKDLYNSNSETRRFHFLELTTKNDSLLFTVKMLDEDFEEFDVEYEIKVRD